MRDEQPPSGEADGGGAATPLRVATTAAAPVSGHVVDVADEVLSPQTENNPEPTDVPAAWTLLSAARREYSTESNVLESGVTPAPQDAAGVAVSDVAVDLPPMPVSDGWSFTISPEFMAGFASDYVAAGGDPADGARFFFGDLAVASLDLLAGENLMSEEVRLLLGNLAASGYFGGIWLRDNLRDAPAAPVDPAAPADPVASVEPAKASLDILSVLDLSPSSIAIHLFDALATGLAFVGDYTPGFIARNIARASVPLLLALYGYNKGYLEVVLENPPEGVPSMQDTFACDGFLACTSTAFPLALATRYDAALDKLAGPPSLRWLEMAVWTAVLEGATSTGRFVWESGLASRGAFSPKSYKALVELSSAFLMVSKAAVLSSMVAYADHDAGTARSSLRLQAGLWTWAGTYFGGLASDAPVGTMPVIVSP